MTAPSAAAARPHGSAQQIDRANHAYYVARRARDLRRRVRHAVPRAAGARGRAPRAADSPDSPTQRVGAAPASTRSPSITHRRPMLSLANAFYAEELAAWEERNARILPEVRTAGYTAEIKIDGAAVSLTYEDGRLRRGRDPRQRHHRRGHHRQPAHDRRRPARAQGQGLARRDGGAGRGVPALRQLQQGQPGARAGGRAALRQPPQRRRRRPPPARSRPSPASGGSGMFAFTVEPIEGKLAVAHPPGAARPARGVGLPGRAAPRAARVAGGGAGGDRRPRGAAPARCRSRPTAWWSRSTASPCTSSSASWAGASRAGRSRGSSRPRWRSPGCEEIRINVGRTGALNPYAVLEPVEISGRHGERGHAAQRGPDRAEGHPRRATGSRSSAPAR